MEKSASSMVDEWGKKVRDGGGNRELEMGDYMTHVTTDIIALTTFGSNYEKGKKMFEQQVALINLMDQRDKQQFNAIPGYMFLFSHSYLNPQIIFAHDQSNLEKDIVHNFIFF